MIIGLSGYAQSGKDTVGRILVERHGFRRVSFADKLREVALAIDPIIFEVEEYEENDQVRLSEIVGWDGWDAAKVNYPEVRRLLQAIGTEAGRNILGEDVWVNAALAWVMPHEDIVITDVRFPNEYEALYNKGARLWRVVRQGTGPVNDHPSETALDGYKFDSLIFNNTTIADLERRVEAYLAYEG